MKKNKMLEHHTVPVCDCTFSCIVSITSTFITGFEGILSDDNVGGNTAEGNGGVDSSAEVTGVDTSEGSGAEIDQPGTGVKTGIDTVQVARVNTSTGSGADIDQPGTDG